MELHTPVPNQVGIIENVVTYIDNRGKGYTTECLNFAKKNAEKSNCYKMMLLTCSKNESTSEFYRGAGYNSTDKTAFIQWLEWMCDYKFLD